jgi:hypothetical protein
MFSPEQKEEIIVAVVDFRLEVTDERVKFERAPFDHPEIFVPLDATAPENGVLSTVAGNREGLLANLAVCARMQLFRRSSGNRAVHPAGAGVSGAGGIAVKLPNFLISRAAHAWSQAPRLAPS